MYRFLIVAIPLSLFGALAWLYTSGEQPLYFAVLSAFGSDPFLFPFLDLHALLAANECHRLGVDVYLSNPCDVLGRRHVYSPLWLDLMPGFLTARYRGQLGIAVDLMFIFSLPLIMRPRTAGEFAVCIAAILSTTVVYAAERANNDIFVFLLVVGAGLLLGKSVAKRAIAYCLILLSGLLKFYPLAAFIVVARENWRMVGCIVAVSAAAFLTLWFLHPRELAIVLANPPATSFYGTSFSARDLPFGLAAILPQSTPLSPRMFAFVSFGILCAYSAIAVWKILPTIRSLFSASEPNGPAGMEGEYLLIASILLTGCFFAGQNIVYRGIYFLMVIPGLLELRRSAAAGKGRLMLSLVLASVLFLLWAERINQAIKAGLDMLMTLSGPGWAWGLAAAFWAFRELLWWAIISFLAAVILVRVSQMTIVADFLLLLRRRNTAAPSGERTRRGD